MSSRIERRRFLETSAALAASALPQSPEREDATRAERAFRVRVEAAEGARTRAPVEHRTNGDEERYGGAVASFTKGLPHGDEGLCTPEAYRKLLQALSTGSDADFDAVPGAGLRLVNPRAGRSFVLEGPDPESVSIPPPPAVASAEQASEACELYWQALLRDVPFAEYEESPLVAEAALDLARFASFDWVTPGRLFRGDAPGDLAGPYLSQFLWKEVPFGAIRVEQHVRTATAGLDYLTTLEDWLSVQNGNPGPARHAAAYRYIRSGRDLAAYVGLDFTYQAFLTAALILFGMQGTTDAMREYKGASWDPGNPYLQRPRETGFVTFGSAHALDLVARAATAALRVCWFQKWNVHRRLRPEEYGGRVHAHRAGRAQVPVHEDLLASPALDLVFDKHESYLLPQASPEGSPLHPAYPAGHAAIAGACSTVLKAFFEESFEVDDPVTLTEDGRALVPYQGGPLTVGGELDKLASNVTLGRNWMGIHWRSDGVAGLRLGEAVALALLSEARATHPETFAGLSITRFDGTRVMV